MDLKLFNIQFICLLFIFTVCGYAQNTYYVATNGDNNNTGSESEPFLTIEHAINSFGALGGTCFIKEGTYHEEILVSDKSNITIKAFNNEVVILDGTKEITSSWTPSSGNPNIYETTLTEDIWQLFIDDEQQVSARWPNAQFNDDSVFDQSNWSPSDDSVEKGTIIDIGNLAASGINAQGAIAVANFGSYKTSALNILTHAGSTMTYDENELNGHAGKHYYYFLEKKLELLDTANEWYYDIDTQKLYVWGNPSGKNIRGKVQSYAFTFDDCQLITIENINFFSTTITATGSNNITVNNSLFAYPSTSKRMLGNINAPLVTKLGPNNNNSVGNIKFYQCLFEHTEGEALKLSGTDNTIEDCYFHHIDYTCAALSGLGVSIKNGGENVDFRQNTLHTTGASATLDLGEEQKVSFNDISNTGLIQSDGSVVQITRKNVEGSIIHHNWIHDTSKSGMRYDAPTSSPWVAGTGGLAHHNVMWNLTKAFQIKGNYQEIYNNTCFGNNDVSNDISILHEDYTIKAEWDNQTPYTHSNVNTITRNNAADKISGHRKKPAEEYPVPGIVDHNKYSTTSTDYGINALLEDPDNYDFRPKVGSELIDAGMDIAGITDGFTGSAPDIGAYEREDTWVAGVTWEPDFYPWSFLSLGIEDSTYNNMELSIFPNPVTEEITIKSTFKIKNIAAFNLLGKQVLLENNFNEKIDITILNSGIYILRIQPKNGAPISRKIVIK
ncbi:MAG: T9SS type A sorting domain-containing protein [Urechidicola sp.]|nr:T9SS type A sorting domain-containing protein [Urechidicola sp.]